MTFLTELQSWLPLFSGPLVASIPEPGSPAPSHEKLQFPKSPPQAVVLSFLRHCGCPYAEKTMVQLRKQAARHPDIKFIAVSHSDENSTTQWLKDVGGNKQDDSSPEVEIIVDSGRELYAAWGLGASGLFDVLNRASLSGVGKLEKEDGIKLRDTTSGSRWQKAGSFAVDKEGVVRFTQVATSAEQIADWDQALSKIKNA